MKYEPWLLFPKGWFWASRENMRLLSWSLKRLQSKTSTLLSHSGQGKCFHCGEKSSVPAQCAGSEMRASADSSESTHGKLCSETLNSSTYISPCTWKGLRRLPKLQRPPTSRGTLSWCTLETEVSYGREPPPGLNTSTLSTDLIHCNTLSLLILPSIAGRSWTIVSGHPYVLEYWRSLEELSIPDSQVFSLSVTKLHSFQSSFNKVSLKGINVFLGFLNCGFNFT